MLSPMPPLRRIPPPASAAGDTLRIMALTGTGRLFLDPEEACLPILGLGGARRRGGRSRGDRKFLRLSLVSGDTVGDARVVLKAGSTAGQSYLTAEGGPRALLELAAVLDALAASHSEAPSQSE